MTGVNPAGQHGRVLEPRSSSNTEAKRPPAPRASQHQDPVAAAQAFPGDRPDDQSRRLEHTAIGAARRWPIDDGRLARRRKRRGNAALESRRRLRRWAQQQALTAEASTTHSSVPAASACEARGRCDDARRRQQNCKNAFHDFDSSSAPQHERCGADVSSDICEMPAETLTGVSVRADSCCIVCRHTRTHGKWMRDHMRNPARERKCVRS
jgi:hypothetical protein